MKIWQVNVDVRNFASIYLTDNNGEILHWYIDGPDFRDQLFGANESIKIRSSEKKKGSITLVDIDSAILVCDPFAWIC